MSADAVVALVIFLFPLAYSPGPGNAFFAGIGSSQGLRAAVPALAGYHVMTFVVTALVGAGMGAALLGNDTFVKILSGTGSLYVLWLAWTFTRVARTESVTTGRGVPAQELKIGFRAGAIVLLLNPKAYYIIAVMFTQHRGSSEQDAVLTVLMVTIVFTANNLIAFTVWTAAGRSLTALLRSEQSRHLIDNLFAATLAGVAIWMAIPLFA